MRTRFLISAALTAGVGLLALIGSLLLWQGETLAAATSGAVPEMAPEVWKWGLMAAIIWLSLAAYGANVAPGIAMILMAVLALAAAVPNAPGYVGAIQAAYVFALGPFGISEEIAFAASVMFLVVQWVPVTAAGAWYFITGGLHVDEVRREIEEAEAEQEETAGQSASTNQ